MNWFSEQRKRQTINRANRKREKNHIYEKDLLGFKFRRSPEFGSYPEWIDEEKAERRVKPEGKFYLTAVSYHVMSPSGEDYEFKWYQMAKKIFSFDDVAVGLKALEDRNCIHIEKTVMMEQAVEDKLKEYELLSFRGKLIKSSNLKHYETTEE